MKVASFTKNTLALAVSAASVMSFNAVALEGNEVSMLEEVIVTATARAQSVQDIPFNISAVSGEDLEKAGIINQDDLIRSIPGVSAVDKGYRNSGIMNQITIRGLNTNTGSNGDMAYNSAPTVSTYVGSTPMFANFILKDLERVEILRGPQGTLYGSGNLGGTVRYIPNKPSTEAFEGKVSTNVGQSKYSDGYNTNHDIVLNIPVSDTLAARVYAGQIDNDGVTDYSRLYQLDANGHPVADACWDGDCGSESVDDFTHGGPVYTSKKDADTTKISYGRASVLWEPTEEVSLLLNYQKQQDDIGARRGYTPNAADDGTTFGKMVSGRPQLEASSRDVEMFSLEADWDLGFATLSASAANYETDGVGSSDNTGFYSKVSWGGAYMAQPRPFNVATRGYEDKSEVYELRLVSNGENFVDWTVGMFAMQQDFVAYQDSTLPSWVEWAEATMIDSDLGNDYIDGVFDQGLIDYYVGVYGSFSQSALGKDHHGWWQAMDENDFHMVQTNDFKEQTFYGELTFNFSDEFRATVGARAFSNELTAAVEQEVRTFPAGDGNTLESKKEDDVIGKVNLSYDISDSQMLYGTVSEGYRRGGANGYPMVGFYASAPSMLTYESDTVTNYELGLKGSTDTLRYTVALFMEKWDKPQINTIALESGVYIVQNGDKAETKGVELELEAYLTENLNLSLGYAYVNAELTADFYRADGSLVATSGNKLPGVSEHSANVALDYGMGLDNGMDMNLRLSGFYQSESENSINNTSALYGTKFAAFSIWEASASLSNETWSATIYAKNLLNEEGVTAAFKEEHMGSNQARNYGGNNSSHNYIATPRTIGASLSYNF